MATRIFTYQPMRIYIHAPPMDANNADADNNGGRSIQRPDGCY